MSNPTSEKSKCAGVMVQCRICLKNYCNGCFINCPDHSPLIPKSECKCETPLIESNMTVAYCRSCNGSLPKSEENAYEKAVRVTVAPEIARLIQDKMSPSEVKSEEKCEHKNASPTPIGLAKLKCLDCGSVAYPKYSNNDCDLDFNVKEVKPTIDGLKKQALELSETYEIERPAVKPSEVVYPPIANEKYISSLTAKEVKPSNGEEEFILRMARFIEHRKAVRELPYDDYVDLKDFIRSEVSHSKTLILEKIEKMMEKHKDNPTHEKDEIWGCLECYDDKVKNEVLSDVVKLIKGGK